MDLGPRLLGYGYIGPCIVRVRVSISWVFNIETMGSLSKRSKSVEKMYPKITTAIDPRTLVLNLKVPGPITRTLTVLFHPILVLISGIIVSGLHRAYLPFEPF